MFHFERPPDDGRQHHDIFADAGCLQLLFACLNAERIKRKVIKSSGRKKKINLFIHKI